MINICSTSCNIETFYIMPHSAFYIMPHSTFYIMPHSTFTYFVWLSRSMLIISLTALMSRSIQWRFILRIFSSVTYSKWQLKHGMLGASSAKRSRFITITYVGVGFLFHLMVGYLIWLCCLSLLYKVFIISDPYCISIPTATRKGLWADAECDTV